MACEHFEKMNLEIKNKYYIGENERLEGELEKARAEVERLNNTMEAASKCFDDLNSEVKELKVENESLSLKYCESQFKLKQLNLVLTDAINEMGDFEAQVKELKQSINEWYRIDLLQVYSGPDDEANFHRSQLLEIKKLLSPKDSE